MFEVISRAGCARTGKYSDDRGSFDTPALLFLDTERFTGSGVTLARKDGANVISAGGMEISLPDYSGYPHSHDAGIEPMLHGRTCLLRPNAHPEAIKALRGQADLFILENSIELYNNAKLFIDTLVKTRDAIGFQSALYLPGIALPNNAALLAYLGADILDTARLAVLSSEGWFLTQDGAWLSSGGKTDPCQCEACSAGDLYSHNSAALHSEILRIRARISNGTIREFVEYRSKTSPKLVEMLRQLDMQHFHFQEQRFPMVSGKFAATTRLSLGRPDIVRFRNRIIERFRKPPTPDILVLLPCSARKPYSQSKSHGFFARAIEQSRAGPRVHEVIVTSPLGLVPRELELFYPAQHYDIPVTGHWFEDEKRMINILLKEYLKINKYSQIINHLGDPRFLEGIDAQPTGGTNPTSEESLACLTKALATLAPDRQEWKSRSSEEIASMARFQFGIPAGELFSDCAMVGRYPNVKVTRQGKQLASISQANGMLVPTIDGAGLLAHTGIHTVTMSEFELTGNLFAVGVESADSQIRAGDEVAILKGGKLAASGTARMSGEEMAQSDRGEAVRIRHKIR